MPITKTQLRQLLGLETNGPRWTVDTVAPSPAPTATTFKLTKLIDSELDAKAFAGRYIYNVATQASYRIKSVDHTTGVLTTAQTMSAVPTTGQTIEVHRYDPTVMNQALNDGLSRCKRLKLVSITPVAQQGDYSLVTLTDLAHKRQVLNVYYRTTIGGITGPRQDVQWWDVKPDVNGTNLILTVYPAPYNSTGLELVVEYKAGYGPLTAETDSASVDELWARAACRMALYDLLLPSIGAGKERQRMDMDRGDAARKFKRYSRLNQAKEPQRIQQHTPMIGSRVDTTTWVMW